jgi:hypothetical protein
MGDVCVGCGGVGVLPCTKCRALGMSAMFCSKRCLASNWSAQYVWVCCAAVDTSCLSDPWHRDACGHGRRVDVGCVLLAEASLLQCVHMVPWFSLSLSLSLSVLRCVGRTLGRRGATVSVPARPLPLRTYLVGEL